MQRFSVITSLLLSLMALYPVTSFASEKSDIVIKIIEVNQRQPSTSEATGFATLQFVNKGPDWIRIHFVHMFGPGGPGASLGLIEEKSYFVIPPGYEKLGGNAAIVDYVWKDLSGNIVLKGSYDLSQQSFLLKPNEQMRTYVPIVLPKAGQYKLLMHFNNRFLEPILHMHGNCGRDDWLGCFEGSDEAAVSIRAKDSVHKN
jgi:hypothetical protein